MPIHIVRLGSPRAPDEGLRIGTVRRPPRGVPKERFTEDDWYDVWLPELAPSADLVKQALEAETDDEWRAFVRKYRKEMSEPAAARLLQLVAAMSHRTNLAVGCYCEDEERCHRSELRTLLDEAGAEMA